MVEHKLYKKFFLIVFCVVGSFIIIASSSLLVCKLVLSKNNNVDNNNNFSNESFVDKIFLPPKKTKIIVMGLDKAESLTDSLFCVCFDRETQKLDVISIPRDTYIRLSSKMIREFKNIKKNPPSIMKINAVHAYAGKEHGNEFLKNEVEELLNIKLDYYVAVNLSAFAKIVNAVGGIYMDIPSGGMNYDDPFQNLHIHIPAGKQLLNGKMAEGVVRFRKTYKRGDLQRIEMQQQFMKEFISQVLNKKSLMNNWMTLFKTLLQDVETNFGIDDLPKYIKYINKINASNLYFHVLPGIPETIDKVSYFILDKKATNDLIDAVIFSKNTSQT